MRLRSRRRGGFTLMELLVACALTGIVLALAMQGFMDINRVSDLARSRMMARSEAEHGLQTVVDIVRRCQIIYFNGRPLNKIDDVSASGANTADINNALNNNKPNTQVLPPTLATDSPANGKDVYYNEQDPGDLTSLFAAMHHFKHTHFRFYDPVTPPTTTTDVITNPTANHDRLQTNDPTVTDPYDKYFSGPLFYGAEAKFSDAQAPALAAAAGTDTNGELPISWTFYVLYLCPMPVTPPGGLVSLPSWVSRGGYTDNKLDKTSTNGTPWARSAIPFELRLLTITGVPAGSGALQFDPAPGAMGHSPSDLIMGVPFDYLQGKVVYDPVAIPMQVNATSFLVGKYTYPISTTTTTFRNASGQRVLGTTYNAQIHANYNNIGNDPPSNQALGYAGVTSTDRVLVSYIDPDDVSGTCIRLLNTIAPQGHAVKASAANAKYRPYLNAYISNPQSTADVGFLYDTYNNILNAPLLTANGAGMPTRAFISITVRFRNNSQVPFQFATENMELDLDNLTKYQSLDRRSRQ
ncbi:MAG TPA: prepilin-type N-terminal cleavage/methylation domain-containing protein [Oscillatoriaceae cyanobacterium]